MCILIIAFNSSPNCRTFRDFLVMIWKNIFFFIFSFFFYIEWAKMVEFLCYFFDNSIVCQRANLMSMKSGARGWRFVWDLPEGRLNYSLWKQPVANLPEATLCCQKYLLICQTRRARTLSRGGNHRPHIKDRCLPRAWKWSLQPGLARESDHIYIGKKNSFLFFFFWLLL